MHRRRGKCLYTETRVLGHGHGESRVEVHHIWNRGVFVYAPVNILYVPGHSGQPRHIAVHQNIGGGA